MRVCSKCGFVDNLLWRHSRFEYNTDYMRTDDFKKEYPKIWKELSPLKNHQPVKNGHYIYYKRGTGSIQIYRVWENEYNIPRERKKH